MTEEKEIIKINTKEELREVLKREFIELDGYKRYILIFEVKRLSEIYGIYKIDYYDNGNLKHRGSLILPITGVPVFENLDIGKSKFFGLTLDSKEETIGKMIGDFFKRTFKEGKLQDFI